MLWQHDFWRKPKNFEVQYPQTSMKATILDTPRHPLRFPKCLFTTDRYLRCCLCLQFFSSVFVTLSFKFLTRLALSLNQMPVCLVFKFYLSLGRNNLSRSVIPNRSAVAHKDAMKRCQGCHQITHFLTLFNVLLHRVSQIVIFQQVWGCCQIFLFLL